MLIIYYMSNTKSDSDSENKKLTRLSEVRYRKTGNEVQSNLTQEDINLLLEEYEEVNDVTTELKTGIHIRYYSLVKDKKKRGELKRMFRLGGTIIKIDPEFKYVVLTNGKLSWCVQLDNTIIYKKMSIKDIKNFYENELDDKDNIIKQKDKKIDKLKKIVEQLLEENKVMKKYIKSL
jgi:hypothetical protein